MGDDLINSFFNFGPPTRPPPRQIEPPNKIRRKEVKREVNDFERDEEAGTSYAAKHKEREELRLITQSMNATQSSKDIIKIDDSDGEEEDLAREEPEFPELTVFDRYDFDLPPQELPILSKREEILHKIESNSIVVLTATTGTGKSSQVPQYILEEAAKGKKNCNIIVTQPRRIAGKFRDVLLNNYLICPLFSDHHRRTRCKRETLPCRRFGRLSSRPRQQNGHKYKFRHAHPLLHDRSASAEAHQPKDHEAIHSRHLGRSARARH